jgi:hypothetical protein
MYKGLFKIFEVLFIFEQLKQFQKLLMKVY